MKDVLSLAEEDTQLKKASVNEYAGPCPGCGGNDRFRVHYSQGSGWRFMCRYCWDAGQYIPEKGHKRGWGDEIDYLRHYRKMSFQDARALCLDGQEEETERREPGQAVYLSEKWQSDCQKALKKHAALLWSEDRIALEYARGRGLYDHIIKQFQIGYSLHRGIPYLVIPSINTGHYVTVYRRDLRPDVPHNERWKDAPGGAKDELYLADCLYVDVSKPVVLCEDVFSALSIYQECGDKVNVVATGGVKCCMTTKWIARLACMPLVLVALDADPAGDKQSQEWLKLLKNARRLRPLLNDPNDMLMDGWDLRSWVLQAVQGDLEEDAFFCSVCGMDGNTASDTLIFEIDDMGEAFCPDCWGKRQLRAAPEVMTKEQFMSIAHQIAGSLPGCEVHIDPPGYTIQDRVREIEQEARDTVRRRSIKGKVGAA